LVRIFSGTVLIISVSMKPGILLANPQVSKFVYPTCLL